MLFFPLYKRRGLTPIFSFEVLCPLHSKVSVWASSDAHNVSSPLRLVGGSEVVSKHCAYHIEFRRAELRSNSGSSSVLLNENLLRLASDLDTSRKKNLLELTPFNAIFLH